MAGGEVEIVTGTYEELLLGYKLVDEHGVYSLQPSFTDHSHTGCIKSVAISRRGILASGSTDETVRLFNLRRRSELGSLMEHEGAVTCVEFYGGSHLFTASQDKSVCIWKTFTWECLRTLRGHKGGVNWVSVHPSGKLALSVGQDKTMHTWNLVRGRSAFTTNIKLAGDLVSWSPSGSHYILVINNCLDVYNTQTASVECTIKAPGRVNALVFLEESVVAFGGEGGDIVIHDLSNKSQLTTINTDTVRIRGLACRRCPSNADKLLLVSASSDGWIKVWHLHKNMNVFTTNLLTEHNTKFRLTCLAVTPPRADNSNKTTKGDNPSKAVSSPVKTEPAENDTSSEDPDSASDRTGSVTEKVVDQKKRKRKRKHMNKTKEDPQTKSESTLQPRKKKRKKKAKRLQE